MQQEYFSTIDIARILNISRVAVFKKIKSGEIKAKRIGRNYFIDKEELSHVLGKTLSAAKKHEIESAVKKTVREYGETLKLLGRE